MSAEVLDIFQYVPRPRRDPPTEPATVIIIPVILRPQHCCVLKCDNTGVVAIHLADEHGAIHTKFFCRVHDPD